MTAWHLKTFVEANERGLYDSDYEIDFTITFYFRSNRVIGYTNYGSIVINLNTSFLGLELPKIVNTLIHEYCHLVGHHHSYYNPGWGIWNNTAPYYIGHLAQRYAETMLDLPLAPVYNPPVSLFSRIKRFFFRWL